MKDIIKLVKSLEDSDLLLKGANETIQNEAKEQKRWFLSMLLDTFNARLLGTILAGKGIIRAGEGILRTFCESLTKSASIFNPPSSFK